MSSEYKLIDISSWPRRTTFEFFSDYEDPFFNITGNVDVTELRQFCKQNELSYSLAALFISQKAVNAIPEFRQRLLDGKIIEYASVDSTQTTLNDDETFSFCYFENRSDIFEFDAAGRAAREKYLKLKTFDVETDRIDLIYYSVIPWISFTSFKHASRSNNLQTVPRIVFGKVYSDGAREKMPISVEVHHALVDGIHVGRYFEFYQRAVDELSKTNAANLQHAKI
ncbi:MAG: CatA-like O-acetyltransferase [Pyrinomonadaceae bacterium]